MDEAVVDDEATDTGTEEVRAGERGTDCGGDAKLRPMVANGVRV